MNEKRYTVLLTTLLLLFAVYPFSVETRFRGDALAVVVSLVIISVVWVVSSHKARLLFLGLAIISLYGDWISYFGSYPNIELIGACARILLLTFVILLILKDIIEAQEVSRHILSGCASVYLLLGLLWATLYWIIEFFTPGAIQDKGGNITELGGLLYYSFVTITTLGYGDIIPTTVPARMFSVLEAIIGQLFLTVLIARFVGLHIAQASRKES